MLKNKGKHYQCNYYMSYEKDISKKWTYIKRSKPVNLKIEDEKLFVHEFQKYINNSYYVIKKNLYIKNYDIYKFKYFIRF